MLKKLIRDTLLKFGYEVKRAKASDSPLFDPEKYGFRPRTLVDAGVGYGTPGLHEAFPEAYHVLIEPLREFEPRMQEILKKYRGTYFLTAVGARAERVTINIEPNTIMKSSMHEHTPLTSTGDRLDRREIPVTTLDALMEEHDFEPPFGLKIDTEGHELEVVRGASSFLRHTEFVIAEVSVSKRFQHGYTFAEFIDAMAKNGFHLADLLRAARNARSELLFVDALFKRAA